MKNKVFRMKEAEDKEEEIQQIKFFLTNRGRLNQICFIERHGKKTIWGYSNQTEWNFNEFGEEKLIEVFLNFALRNPRTFRTLYETLKQTDPKVFECIKKAREKAIKMFQFD